MTELIAAAGDAFTLANLLLILAGVVLGIVVGAIPGLSAPMAIAIAVPLTFYMSPLAAIAFLISVNKGGTFGGSISGILLNTPGSPEAAATALDGYPLARKGQPLRALRTALYASVGGDLFSDIVLIIVAAPLALVALRLGPVEIGALVVVALAFVAELLAKSPAKGLIAVAFGILVATIGADPTMAVPRLTFGMVELQGGVPLMSVGIGILALSEVLIQLENRLRRRGAGDAAPLAIGRSADDRLSRSDLHRIAPVIGRSAVIGTAVGALPGLGTTLAAFLGYSAARRASRNPESFGKGNIEGIAGAEAANSAVVGSNLIPLLALGIPGNVAAALLVGAFIIHGIVPGPWLFEEQPRLVYGLFISMIVANFINLAIAGGFLRWFALVFRSGGSPGFRLQTYCQDRFKFRALINPFSTQQYFELAEMPSVEIGPGPGRAWVAVLPTLRRPRETFRLCVKCEDVWGNPSNRIDQVVTFRPSSPVAGLPDQDRIAIRGLTAGNLQGIDLTCAEAGTGRLRFTSDRGNSSVDLAALPRSGHMAAFEGLDAQVEITAVDGDATNRRVSFTRELGIRRTGDTRFHVRVTQMDGHQAWSSPIYVFCEER